VPANPSPVTRLFPRHAPIWRSLFERLTVLFQDAFFPDARGSLFFFSGRLRSVAVFKVSISNFLALVFFILS